jgi:hypothetical protein
MPTVLRPSRLHMFSPCHAFACVALGPVCCVRPPSDLFLRYKPHAAWWESVMVGFPAPVFPVFLGNCKQPEPRRTLPPPLVFFSLCLMDCVVRCALRSISPVAVGRCFAERWLWSSLRSV